MVYLFAPDPTIKEPLFSELRKEGEDCLTACFDRMNATMPEPSDLFLYVGRLSDIPDFMNSESSGSSRLSRVLKIADPVTGHDCYPDILTGSFFKEVSIDARSCPGITDVFRAAQPYFSPERMLFYAASSDIAANDIPYPGICRDIRALRTLQGPDATLGDEEEALVTVLSARLSASVSMELTLRGLAEYLHFKEGNAAPSLREFLNGIPAELKRKEGKKYLEQFRSLCTS